MTNNIGSQEVDVERPLQYLYRSEQSPLDRVELPQNGIQNGVSKWGCSLPIISYIF